MGDPSMLELALSGAVYGHGGFNISNYELIANPSWNPDVGDAYFEPDFKAQGKYVESSAYLTRLESIDATIERAERKTEVYYPGRQNFHCRMNIGVMMASPMAPYKKFLTYYNKRRR